MRDDRIGSGRSDDSYGDAQDLGPLDEGAIVAVLSACREALAPGREDLCPGDARRAALDVFLGHPEGEGVLLDVLYDSAAAPLSGAGVRSVTPSPARTIRWGKGEIALDMQVRRTQDGVPVLFVALQPPPRPGVKLVVRVKPQETARRAEFDPTGSAEVRLPARAESFWAAVHGVAGEMYRIGTTKIDPMPDPQ